MPDYSKFYEARKIITDILRDDLIGPVKKDEILPELPTQYYIMGKLYPQNDEGDVIDLVRNPFLENAVETYDTIVVESSFLDMVCKRLMTSDDGVVIAPNLLTITIDYHRCQLFKCTTTGISL